MALGSLQNQTSSNFEIVIIDNNSIDDTRAIIEEYIQNDSRIRYVFESKIGLSNARNKGMMESSGDYVAYVDDDCIMPAGWIETARNVIGKKSPDIFGGPVFPFYQTQKPEWYKDDYGTFHFGTVPRKLEIPFTLFGGNIFIKRSVFDVVGLFRTDLGMMGDQILYSEESEFQLRYLSQNPNGSIYYDPKLVVQHYLRPEKMTLRWNILAFFGKGKSNYQQSKGKGKRRSTVRLLLDLMASIYKIGALIVYGLIFRSRSQFPYFGNFVMERISGNFKKLGWIAAQL